MSRALWAAALAVLAGGVVRAEPVSVQSGCRGISWGGWAYSLCDPQSAPISTTGTFSIIDIDSQLGTSGTIITLGTTSVADPVTVPADFANTNSGNPNIGNTNTGGTDTGNSNTGINDISNPNPGNTDTGNTNPGDTNINSFSITDAVSPSGDVTLVPEPATLSLVLMGLAAFGFWRLRKA